MIVMLFLGEQKYIQLSRLKAYATVLAAIIKVTIAALGFDVLPNRLLSF